MDDLHWMQFVGPAIGLIGLAYGAYNGVRKRQIMRLRDTALGAFWLHLRGTATRSGAPPETPISLFEELRTSFLNALAVVLEPTELDLRRWQSQGVLRPADADHIRKVMSLSPSRR